MTPRVALGDVAEINPPLPLSARKMNPEEMVTFIPMAAVSVDGGVRYDERRPVSSLLQGYTSFARGDVLLAKITPCLENGKAADLSDLPSELGFGSTEFHVLRAGAELDVRYLFHMVWNPLFRRGAAPLMTGTAGQKRLPADYLRRFRIPLPPLVEQRRIAAMFDKVDAVRRKQRDALSLVGHLSASAFLEMFGDPVKNDMHWTLHSASHAISSIEAGSSVGGDPRARQDNEWAVLKISAVTSGTYRPDECKVVDEPPDRVVVPAKGDLLFSRANTRELVAATCLVDHTEARLFLPDKLWRITPNPELADAAYLRYLLSHGGFRQKITAQATGTSGSMLNVSQEKLLRTVFPLPPLDLQRRFSALVWKAIETRKKMKDAAAQADSLLESLTQDAFTGST